MTQKQPNLTEELVTEYTLHSMKKNPEGVTSYPILEFDQRALDLLSEGVSETLRSSKTIPNDGLDQTDTGYPALRDCPVDSGNSHGSCGRHHLFPGSRFSDFFSGKTDEKRQGLSHV